MNVKTSKRVFTSIEDMRKHYFPRPKKRTADEWLELASTPEGIKVLSDELVEELMVNFRKSFCNGK